MKIALNTAAALLCAATAGLVGCAPETAQDTVATDSHSDEHVHPETFSAALAMLTKQQEAIAEAFAAGDPEAAHEPLHEVGHTLELLPELAKEAGLDEEALAAVTTATGELFEAFGGLDEVLHGGEDLSYDDVKDKITTAMGALSSMPVGDGDEGHGDHEGNHEGEHAEGHDSHAGHDEDGEDHK